MHSFICRKKYALTTLTQMKSVTSMQNRYFVFYIYKCWRWTLSLELHLWTSKLYTHVHEFSRMFNWSEFPICNILRKCKTCWRRGFQFLLVELPPIVPFDVWVNDCDKLPTSAVQLRYHPGWVRKFRWVPRKIFLRICVFDIEPHHVHRNIKLVKLGFHLQQVSFVVIVPPALVICDAEERG